MWPKRPLEVEPSLIVGLRLWEMHCCRLQRGVQGQMSHRVSPAQRLLSCEYHRTAEGLVRRRY